jgi:hypothetical protein
VAKNGQRGAVQENRMGKLLDVVTDQFLEPMLYWLLAHPLLTTLILAVLIWWVGQSYWTRMR